MTYPVDDRAYGAVRGLGVHYLCMLFLPIITNNMGKETRNHGVFPGLNYGADSPESLLEHIIIIRASSTLRLYRAS